MLKCYLSCISYITSHLHDVESLEMGLYKIKRQEKFLLDSSLLDLGIASYSALQTVSNV